MQFGVQLYPFYTFQDLAAIVQFVRETERLGYDYVGIPEHIAFGKEHEGTMGASWWDPLVLATHLAGATRTIRFIFTVLVLPQHNPFYLAKGLATLDHASGGRISIGVGVGWIEEEFRLLGADFHKRGALMDEYIKALRVLWTQDPAEFHGKFLSFSDVSFLPKPVQKPHPPIFVGGSAKVSVRRAAELGDGWMPMGAPFDEFKEALAALKQRLADRGRPVEGFPLFRTIPFHERSARFEAHTLASGGGSIGGLQGDPEKALEYIRECVSLGVTHMTVQLPTDTVDAKAAELARFAHEVLPKVRESSLS